MYYPPPKKKKSLLSLISGAGTCGYRAFHWNMGSLPGATSLKKDGSPSSTSHQMQIVHQLAEGQYEDQTQSHFFFLIHLIITKRWLSHVSLVLEVMGEPICLHSVPVRGYDESSGCLTLPQQCLTFLNCVVWWLVVTSAAGNFCLILFYPDFVFIVS